MFLYQYLVFETALLFIASLIVFSITSFIVFIFINKIYLNHLSSITTALIRGFILSLIISISLSLLHVAHTIAYPYLISDKVFDYPGWANYYQAPLIKGKYLLSFSDGQDLLSEGPEADITWYPDESYYYSEGLNVYKARLLVKEVTVINNYILIKGETGEIMKPHKIYLIINSTNNELYDFSNFDELLMQWKKLNQNESPIFLSPYEYFDKYWSEHPNRLAKYSYWVIIISIILLLYYVFISYYIKKTRKYITAKNHNDLEKHGNG